MYSMNISDFYECYYFLWNYQNKYLVQNRSNRYYVIIPICLYLPVIKKQKISKNTRCPVKTLFTDD